MDDSKRELQACMAAYKHALSGRLCIAIATLAAAVHTLRADARRLASQLAKQEPQRPAM